MKDTLRVLVSWKCNLKCSYCCNEQERFRKDIHPISIDNINWDQYQTYCISGGEPLLNLDTVYQVLNRCDKSKMIVLYTNGILLTPLHATTLEANGVKAINVGLHYPNSFNTIIKRVTANTIQTGLSVRFHAQNIYQESLVKEFPNVSFRFWTMNDCDRDNEDRFVLT